MRFMVIRKADAQTEAGVMPSEQLLTDMTKYNEEMFKAGVLVGGEGLKPSSQGARVKFGTDGKPVVIDGPFAEAKELIAGFTMIQTASLAEALEWVKRWPASDAPVELEIRPVFEADDFGEEFTPEMRALEDQMRADLEKK